MIKSLLQFSNILSILQFSYMIKTLLQFSNMINRQFSNMINTLLQFSCINKILQFNYIINSLLHFSNITIAFCNVKLHAKCILLQLCYMLKIPLYN